MITAALLTFTVAVQEPVQLQRVFSLGEKSSYAVRSTLQVQTKSFQMTEFIPFDIGLEYDFSTEVTKMKADGIAELRYKRPTMTQVDGETFDRPERRHVEKVNLDSLMTVSPINEILSSKDQTKKDGKWMTVSGPPRQDILGSFTQEIYRLALFVGSIDSSLDFNPKLPFEPVKPGDTWKRTAGFSPQQVKGTEGKSAVQRLDYTYEYKGTMEAAGRKIHRVSATLALDTDAGAYINQLLRRPASETGLKEAKLQLRATIDYDLDLKTCKTLKAVANSEGSVAISVTSVPQGPVVEERLKGTTTLTPKK
ncbi:MAG: hypothetical protein HONBIEJF_02739 [Fimbriimonadaceae bacterium]|nr:hypothetical protein [Fimbriimonadaceae bacterium]